MWASVQLIKAHTVETGPLRPKLHKLTWEASYQAMCEAWQTRSGNDNPGAHSRTVTTDITRVITSFV